MPRLRVDLEAPEGVPVLLEYRGAANLWTELGTTTDRRTYWTLPEQNGIVLVRATPKNGGPALEKSIRVGEPIADEIRSPADVTLEAPTIAQDGPTFALQQNVPPDIAEQSLTVEVRQGPSGGDVDEAQLVGFAQPGEELTTDAWSDLSGQDIHARVIRDEDGVASAWTTTPAAAAPSTDPATEDFNDNWAGATFLEWAPGVPSVEIVASGIQPRVLTRADFGTNSRASVGTMTRANAGGDGASVSLPEVTLDQPEAVQLELQPEIGSITRPVQTRADYRKEPRAVSKLIQGVIDPEARRRHAWNVRLGDRMPPHVKRDVGWNSTGSPLTASDFRPYRPGAVIYPLRYGLKVTFARMLLGSVINWRRIKVRRWCRDVTSCHLKPYSFVRKQAGHPFGPMLIAGTNASGDYVLANANDATTMPGVGLVIAKPTSDTFRVATAGRHVMPSHGLTPGTVYYVGGAANPGEPVSAPPGGGALAQPILKVINANEIIVFETGAT